MAEQPQPATWPKYTMIIDQSAHLDWDWLTSFAHNYWYYTNGCGVDVIFTKAINNLQSIPNYYYTVCEMGFLRRFVETHPDQIKYIQYYAATDQFQVISGGVTSADCLVCSGEGFIRNYLVGQTWLKATLGLTPKPHCWLPDDFGQGPELPVMLEALGFNSVCFARLPGSYKSCARSEPSDELKDKGFDFMWQASKDKSTVFAHWIGGNYNIGNVGLNPDLPQISSLLSVYNPVTGSKPLDYTAAKTAYMYAPCDDDFSMPIDQLAQTINNWNQNSAASSNVRLKQGTFDQFVTAVLKTPKALRTFQYNGTPLFTGYYASRPELKTLHYKTVRALVAAEVIGMLTQPGSTSINSMLPIDFWARIDQTWNDFAPSTHHDYICGTATDAVYANDQLPLLRGAASAARLLRGLAINALSSMVFITNVDLSKVYTLVANPLGFERTGVVAIEGIRSTITSLTWPNTTSTQTQQTIDGCMLLYATVPSFGYTIGYGQVSDGDDQTYPNTPVQPTSFIPATVSPTEPGQAKYVISNEYLTATITASAGWGLDCLIDNKASNADNAKVLSGAGNVVTFYDDSTKGGIYQFGNEWVDDNVGKMPPLLDVTCKTDGACLGAIVLETGPLMVRVRTEVMYEFTFNGKKICSRFTRDYELHTGEAFLRMRTTGAAPYQTTVMTKFPLAKQVTGLVHGTGYHWTDVQPGTGWQPPTKFWGPPTFQATHDFLLPYNTDNNSKNTTLAAIYHESMPAWAFDTDGSLIGCMLRNNGQSDGHGAVGTDPMPHTQYYAIRVPTGLSGPETGQPLREAQSFHTPMVAVRMPDGPWDGTPAYPGMLTSFQDSLASVPADSPAILTVAKPGSYDASSLVLRLYQPTNNSDNPLSVVMSLNSVPTSATLVTATETLWTKGDDAVPIDTKNRAVTVTMSRPVATVSLGGMGRVPASKPD